jgi:hypothetical protein
MYQLIRITFVLFEMELKYQHRTLSMEALLNIALLVLWENSHNCS